MIREKIYTLDSGMQITPTALATRLGCTTPSARHRLDTYTDDATIFTPLGKHKPKRQYKCSTYKLSDGSELTAREISEKYGVALGTTRNRLSNGVVDVAVLKRQPKGCKQTRLGSQTNGSEINGMRVSEQIKLRNGYCPWSKLILTTI